MDTVSPVEESFLEAFEVSSSTASTIHVAWLISGSIVPFLDGFKVHFQKVASTYIQYGPKLSPTESEYEIQNLVADTYYKVCLVIYRNDTNPFRECVDASTTNWQLPVSVGSSIGAILALSIIVLIVLLSRCQLPMKYRRKKAKSSNKYDTMSSHYHDDHYDFSETMTHGNDDDFTSEIDNDEDAFIDTTNESNRHTRSQIEKFTIANGLSRGHVHPHPHHHSLEHRHSIGRILCPTNPSQPHSRPFRSYSIQADGHICCFNQSCSPLVMNPRKDSVGKEWTRVEEMYPRHVCSHNSKAEKIARKEKQFGVLKEDTEQEQPDCQLCSNLPPTFTYIDEIPEKQTNMVSKSNLSPDVSPTKDIEFSDTLLMRDLKYEDMSAFGAVGGITDTMVRQNSEGHCDGAGSVEMTSKINRMIAATDGVTFEEHAL